MQTENQPAQPTGRPDFNPALPEALRKQVAEVDAMYTNGAPPPQDTGAPAAVAAPEGAAPAASPPAEAQPPATPPPAEEGQTWEQKFKSQQGRFEQMLRANEALSGRVNELQQSISLLQSRGVEPPPPPKPAAERVAPKYVKDEEVQEYGEEFIDIVGRRAKEVYAPEFDELAERMKRLEGQVAGVGQVVTTSVKRGMYETLDHDVPNWKDVNKSKEFKEWLARPDPYSGQTRHSMLTSAYAGHETGRVVAFFKGFLTEAAGLPSSSPSPGSSAPPLAQPGNGSGKPSLEDFAAPGRARSAPQNLPPEKPVYSQAWIAKFYADKLAGKYRGRDADVAAVEADIFQAQHEGRIHN